VLFDPGQATLKPDGQQALTRLAKKLIALKGRHFQVAGHTDSQPIRRSPFKTNWELSVARAVQVVLFLRRQGVPPRRLSASGFSRYQPVASNRSPLGKLVNRRVEITLIPYFPAGLLHRETDYR
jgi:chemotaxis protein MotB